MNYVMLQRHLKYASQKKKLSEPSDLGHTSPSKNAAGKVFLSK